MKNLLISILCFISFSVYTQDKKQQDSINFSYNMGDSLDLAYFADTYGARFYDVNRCCPEHIPVPGEPVPEHFPYAKYANDTSMWEWVPLNIEGIEQTHVYDLKPQYKDTLTRNDGSVIEVPIWIKYPDWVKE